MANLKYVHPTACAFSAGSESFTLIEGETYDNLPGDNPFVKSLIYQKRLVVVKAKKVSEAKAEPDKIEPAPDAVNDEPKNPDTPQ